MSVQAENGYVKTSPASREYVVRLHGTGAVSIDGTGLHSAGYGVERDVYEVYRQKRTRHHLLYSLKGEGWMEFNGRTERIPAGTACYCPYGVGHHLGITGNRWEIAWVSFFAGDKYWEKIIGGRGLSIFQSHYAHEVRDSLVGIRNEIHSAEKFSTDLCATYVRQLELYLKRELLSTQLPTKVREQKVRLQALFTLVEEHPQRAWSIQDLCNESGLYVCPDHFTKLCKKMLAKTPGQIISEIRLRKAADMLLCTDLPLDAIASSIGYGSSFALSSAFKRYHGVSPQSYRNQHSAE